jgi:EAL domain-containing protein (putative c-di-GMP-specific phosphodiesterase class I)
MQVVAEGVENQRQAEFLRRNGCHRLQGFLFGRPQSAFACSQVSETTDAGALPLALN